MKYEGIDTFEDVIRIAEKNEASLKSTPIIPPRDTIKISVTSPGAFSLSSLLQPPNTPSRLKVTIEQFVF